jgi:hypothetical protein
MSVDRFNGEGTQVQELAIPNPNLELGNLSTMDKVCKDWRWALRIPGAKTPFGSPSAGKTTKKSRAT